MNRMWLNMPGHTRRQDRTEATPAPAGGWQFATAPRRQAAAANPNADTAAGQVVISYRGGESDTAATRGHIVWAGQPATASGGDTAILDRVAVPKQIGPPVQRCRL